MDELERAGFAGDQPPPFYRVQSFRKGTALVNLFATERPPARQASGGRVTSTTGCADAASVTAAAERAD